MQKRALITGGSGDLGSTICLRLAAAGMHVIIHTNKNKARAEAILTAINNKGGTGEIVCFDISDADSTEQAVVELAEQAPIQIIVNNAGIHHDAPMAGMSKQAWHDVIDVSLNGFYNVTKPLLLPMMQTRWGRIINVSSISGIRGNRGQANYAAAKAGIIGATKSLAMEVASRGITVNAIAPGIISGSMTKDVFTDEQIKQWVPMKRAGKPEEVAHLIAFLASDDAAYISGQVIAIDGAMI